MSDRDKSADDFTANTSNDEGEVKHNPVDQLTKEEIAQFRLLLKKSAMKESAAEKPSEREKDNLPPWSWRTTNAATRTSKGFSEQFAENLSRNFKEVYGPKYLWFHLAVLIISFIIILFIE